MRIARAVAVFASALSSLGWLVAFILSPSRQLAGAVLMNLIATATIVVMCSIIGWRKT